MNNPDISFIGCGNLATAVITGILSNRPELAAHITVSDRYTEKALLLQERWPIRILPDNALCASSADILFLTVKPAQYEEVIAEIRSSVKPDAVVVSVGAGVSISYVENTFGSGAKIIRIMPNTPALVSEGMVGICPGTAATQQDLKNVSEILSLCAKVEQITEDLFDVVTGVSGSGPAYVYMFIDAMARAAEKDGMDRRQAVAFAAQTAKGAAKMVLESGIDPETLTEQVCSPGGTTIEAVQVFRDRDLAGLVEEAQHACVEKSRIMHK